MRRECPECPQDQGDLAWVGLQGGGWGALPALSQGYLDLLGVWEAQAAR